MEEVTVKFTETEAFHTFIYAGDLKLLYFLMILMALDIGTGIGKAIKNKNLWSRKALFGFSRKIFIFFIVILANIIDQVLGLNGGLVVLTIFFYMANEGLSIVENCAEMGVLIPKEISEKLNVIKSTKNDTTDNLKNDFINENSTKDEESLRK
ncbi:phage holin family protein [Staphylococcus sp. NAM3COL9]|uniref:Phage holin family protein n=1 Tax=Staphylococcus equorum TaxID=246432 RepID=A0A9X4L859_9STAP|nr:MULTISPECIES: phage holin family protein [Staphylococcus]KRG09899.1 holin [Staphylococcus sp. NAM3COL9]MDG0843356.1 phage holin family protein [Staphylococcus equorum]MDG0858667.1 phage holin family protein [Staphylococcus equorum]